MNSDENDPTKSSSYERDYSAENTLIGCFLLTPDTFNLVGDWFTESDFSENNSKLFTAIKTLNDSGEPIDLITLNSKLKDKTLILHATELLSSIGSAANYEYYAKIVKEASTRRRLSEVGQVLTYQANSETPTEDIIKLTEQKIADITSTSKAKGGEIDTKECVDEIIDNVKKLRDSPQDVTGTSTGFHSLDMKLSGLHGTDLIILAARPARGKSAFALQLARNVAITKTPVLFFSLEMGAEQLVQRLVAAESKVSLTAIRSGRVSDVEVQALELGGEIIKSIPMYINDKAGIQVKDIRSQLKLHNSRNSDKIGFVIVDYLQLMAIGGNSKNMVQDVTEISRGLKMIAKDFGVPVLALSQLSRDVEKRGGKPKLSDLRDSGSLEQDADIVLFLHSSDGEEDSMGNKHIELLVSKHRNGSVGDIPLSFNGSKMTFSEVDNTSIW